MNTHRPFALCLLATLSLTTTAAQAEVHAKGLKPSSLMQPVTPLFGTESVSKTAACQCRPDQVGNHTGQPGPGTFMCVMGGRVYLDRLVRQRQQTGT